MFKKVVGRVVDIQTQAKKNKDSKCGKCKLNEPSQKWLHEHSQRKRFQMSGASPSLYSII